MLTSVQAHVTRSAHRQDVDGLRALAVLAILAFHLNLTDFSGGFAGVDIFFVISGFVITRGLLLDLERDQFSLGAFYMRRARRILPALVAVLLASLAAGMVILSPAELREFSESALASLVSVANFYFHDRTNYFANAAHYRPLLHTWSLSIEEQFYLVFPALLAVLVWRAKLRPLTIISGMVALSFSYCVVSGTYSEKHAFYMPMARFWEIGAGALVAAAEARGVVLRHARLLGVTGLVAIGAAIVLFDGEMTQPWMMVIPGTATAVVILSGSSAAGPVFRLFSTGTLVGIGRRSYSIYLVHWPLIVFWRMCIARPLGPADQAMIVAATLLLAAVLWRFIEKPLRAGSGLANVPAFKVIAASFVLVAALGIVARWESATQWRLNADARDAIAQLSHSIENRPHCVPDRNWLPDAPSKNTACRWSRGSAHRTDFVIWGDSHARALAPELAQLFFSSSAMQGGVTVGMANCPPLPDVEVRGRRIKKGCALHNRAILTAIAAQAPKLVVLTGRWANVASDIRSPGDGEPSGRLIDEISGEPMGLTEALVRTTEKLRHLGARVVVVGPVPEVEFDVPATLVRSLRGFGQLPPVSQSDFNQRQRQVMDALARLDRTGTAIVLYPHKALCDGRTCDVAEGIQSLYTDDDHLSAFGAARVVRSFELLLMPQSLVGNR